MNEHNTCSSCARCKTCARASSGTACRNWKQAIVDNRREVSPEDYARRHGTTVKYKIVEISDSWGGLNETGERGFTVKAYRVPVVFRHYGARTITEGVPPKDAMGNIRKDFYPPLIADDEKLSESWNPVLVSSRDDYEHNNVFAAAAGVDVL